eukprot:15397472-Alexandrium_andersonii.AAC.1
MSARRQSTITAEVRPESLGASLATSLELQKASLIKQARRRKGARSELVATQGRLEPRCSQPFGGRSSLPCWLPCACACGCLWTATTAEQLVRTCGCPHASLALGATANMH